MQEKSPEDRISRRDFLGLTAKLAAAITVAMVGPKLNLVRAEENKEDLRIAETTISRKECFKPFERGVAEWQYLAFQYIDLQQVRHGIIISLGELTNPYTNEKTQNLLVMNHNFSTRESQKELYNGSRSFDEKTSTYKFLSDFNTELVKFSYDETQDRYLITIKTNEFDSKSLSPTGLVIKPESHLIPVSKDGNFTVSAFDGGKVIANYFADNIRLENLEGEIIGYGRRDSQNLEIEGTIPQKLDIDHTWVHVSGTRVDGKRFYVTAWKSKTGGQFKFADILLLEPKTNEIVEWLQYNEEDNNFKVNFTPSPSQLETVFTQTFQKQQMAYGGQVSSSCDNLSLFNFEIEGNPGQIIDGKGFLNMVEAHGELVSGGSILGVKISTGNSAVWETTEETYYNFLPLIMREE